MGKSSDCHPDGEIYAGEGSDKFVAAPLFNRWRKLTHYATGY